MMKGIDAALLSVCAAYNLPTVALPVYSPDCDDTDSDDSECYSEEIKEPSRFDPLQLFRWESNSRAHMNRRGGIDWIGYEFETMNCDCDFGNYEESIGRRAKDAGFMSKYKGIYWLNAPRHSEPNVAFTTVLFPVTFL